MSERNEQLLVQDICEAARKILKYTSRFSFEDFTNDEKTIDAVIRNFEIIGEASRHISEETKALHPEIEWRKIMAFRNLLIHEYFGVNTRIVWDIIQHQLSNDLHLFEQLLSGE